MDVIQTPETDRTAAETREAALAEEPELAAHPGPREYVKVAVALAVATGMEVALYYMDIPRGLFIALLLIFASVKFTLVVLWFMHLRFDSPIFRRLFVTGLLLALTLYLIVLTIFGAIKAPFLLGFTAGLLVLIGYLVVSRARSSTPVEPASHSG